jgi:hypothetical protein
MKNIKTLAIGLIIGIMLGMGVFAVEYVINPNPYPIVVNGQQQDIQALNIDGFTYMKLADAAKVLNTSVKFNEVAKQIEINTISTSTEGVSLMSTATAIEYDPITGLPVGAIYIENEKNGKQYKTIQYNGEIYISIVDLKNIFDIQNMFVDGFGIRFTKNEQLIPVDSNDKSNHFFAGSRLYYKKILFENYMGE